MGLVHGIEVRVEVRARFMAGVKVRIMALVKARVRVKSI